MTTETNDCDRAWGVVQLLLFELSEGAIPHMHSIDPNEFEDSCCVATHSAERKRLQAKEKASWWWAVDPCKMHLNLPSMTVSY